MLRHQVAVALLFSPANIRYATGASVMPIYSGTNFARCCLVPDDGDPVLFEFPGSTHVSKRVIEDVRPLARDADTWAAEVLSVIMEIGAEEQPIAIDQLNAPRLLALQERGAVLADVGPVTREARSIKTIDEVSLAIINGAVGDAMLASFHANIRPGVREYELLATLSDTLLRYQGEGLFTRLVASGRNTNPWMSEATDKIIAPGDFVGVDTDAYGIEGYVIDISRTFLCGASPTSGQRDAYRVAYDTIQAMRELIRPGVSYEDFARSVPVLPDRYLAQRYQDLAHHVGLEDEYPVIPYPEDVRLRIADFPEGGFEPRMVLSVECYAGILGGAYGVKLEDQVLVTEAGCELLSTYPYEETLLA